ncbi:similar to Saccharomyces cerevisiae YHR015W MIP6 Putative RNA-binding protein, interacts with Mex67p, which is a component of the nuclear pore involved in nuclear mRNA export [Maudiozyma saulgeensis]|uniref:Similar to Saccharomyces cerevisiae YHR015W MIP6 Putative RNA-binding protein, interacts with Mex67p, which is a component of the nuclear pore involved in nuclear mRNA export n=1 Tax=Maudiozyma saulgeensis TaxID=1789683 RepID=A0A1X7R190_9SACH|nr:similar to Saccharomyces cerevisiae YHR015W MIP6 Putative RNA-binding protein, interacts with Mex67p, which is a component of the nuclear pore involved in nuclear mRNA export [Kazachstania saulgeensis]
MSLISALSHSTTKLCAPQDAATDLHYGRKDGGSVTSETVTESSSDTSGPMNLHTAYSFNNKSGRLNCESYEALFVGDLDPQITESHLTKIFSKYSSFISTKICMNKFTKLSLGHGYLNFGSKNDAELAMEELNYTKIMSKEIRLMPSMRDIKNRTTIGTTVLFSNIRPCGFNLTTRIFFETFRKYGKILSCKLENQNNKAFVTYFNEEDAKNVVNSFDGVSLEGQKLGCSIFTEKYLRNKEEVPVVTPSANFKKEIIIDPVTRGISLQNKKESVTERVMTPIHTSKENSSSAASKTAESQFYTVVIKNFPLSLTEESLPSMLRTYKELSIAPKIRQRQSWIFVRNISTDHKDILIKTFNNEKFFNKTLIAQCFIVKKRSNHLKLNNSVLLTNLCILCNKTFLKHICLQEDINYTSIKIESYQKESITFNGVINCRTFQDATQLINYMNNRLIGGMLVKAALKE